MISEALLLGLGALVLSLLGSALARVLAPRLRFADQPGSEKHKQHSRSVPYGGGVAMGAAVAVMVALAPLLAGTWWTSAEPSTRGPLLPLQIGALAMMLLGIADDARPLGARTKLLVQIAIVTLTLWWGDVHIDSLRRWPWLDLPLTALWCVLVTNAYNLMDHADGCSASVGMISATVLLVAALLAQDLPLALLWITVIGSLMGFLVHNLPPARLYMGDAGSLSLGFLIGTGSLISTFWPEGSANAGSPWAVLAPLFITALPLYDTGVVIVKRLRLRQPLMKGDRNHISHRLGRLGLSPAANLAVVASLQTALAAGALLLRYQDGAVAIVVIGQACCVLAVAVLLEANRDQAR